MGAPGGDCRLQLLGRGLPGSGRGSAGGLPPPATPPSLAYTTGGGVTQAPLLYPWPIHSPHDGDWQLTASQRLF